MQRLAIQNFPPKDAKAYFTTIASAEHDHAGWLDAMSCARLRALDEVSHPAFSQAEHLIHLARRGLPRMHRRGVFGHTLRCIKTKNGRQAQLEGDDLRSAAVVALGMSCVDIAEQRQVLAGGTAADLARVVATRAEMSGDTGTMALAAWAAAEAANLHAATLLVRLDRQLTPDAQLATAECAWVLMAALAARRLGDTGALAERAALRLLKAQGPHGLFPHATPAASGGRLRAHIGRFDDQAYPIQALARLHAAHGDGAALAAAQKCADRLCQQQGPDGQWWWHYDVRDGQVVEGYPVYSVHQYAMAPMALLDLQEAGGAPRWEHVVKGLGWLQRHPEVDEPLISDQQAVIWRKAARREPGKAVRALSAVATALKPGVHLPWLEAAFPPNQVDYECRPYELGWLLYAWLSGGGRRAVSRRWARGDANKKSACLAVGRFASVHAGEGAGGISARQTTTKSALVRDKSRADRREMDAGSWAAAIGVIEQLAGVRLVDDAVAPFPYQGCSLLRTADIFGVSEVLSRACAYCYRNTCCEAPAPFCRS